MAVIKRKISKIYAKADDRNYTHLYKDGKRFDSAISCDRKITHFSSGNPSLRNEARFVLKMYSRNEVQVQEKAYETLRLYSIKKITKVFPNIEKSKYCLRFERYPHQLLRFHAIASGARADRISQGMSRSFGKVFTRASKIKPGHLFLEVCFAKEYDNTTSVGRYLTQLKKLKSKLPFQVYFTVSAKSTSPA